MTGYMYRLQYAGTDCADYGLIGEISFWYHMWDGSDGDAASNWNSG